MTTENTANFPVLALDISAAETNVVLNALAQLPYKSVERIITGVKTQADEQFDPSQPADKQTMHVHLKLDEINLCLGALSELAYNVSADLILKIKEQGEAQLSALKAASQVEKLVAEPVDNAA